MPLEFRLLGPFELVSMAAPIKLTAHKPRAFLAMLLLHADQLVPWHRLLDELWGDDPPPSAVANLRTHAAELRRVFRGGPQLIADPGGYRLQLAQGSLDLAEFDQLCTRARHDRRGGGLGSADAAYRRALRLWRGPPLAGLRHGPMLSAAATALEERRTGVVEDAFDIRLDLITGGGQGGPELVADLRRHLSEHPLRERPRRQLMVALYRLGDVAGALAAGNAARELLKEALGLDPDGTFNRLYTAVLRRDPGLLHAGVQDECRWPKVPVGRSQ